MIDARPVTFKSILISIVLVAISAFAVLASANDTAVKTMASIMLQFNHYPSAAQQSVLLELTNDSTLSESEKSVATAILNIAHHASTADKTILGEISMDDSEAPALRELAQVIRDVNHTVSAADQEKLAELAK